MKYRCMCFAYVTVWQGIHSAECCPVLSLLSQYGELRPTSGYRLRSVGEFGAPQQIQRVLRLGFVIAPTSLNGGQPNFAPCLAISCAGILYINFFTGGGLCCLTEFCHAAAKFTLRPSLAFSNIGITTARHSSSRRPPKFASWYQQ